MKNLAIKLAKFINYTVIFQIIAWIAYFISGSNPVWDFNNIVQFACAFNLIVFLFCCENPNKFLRITNKILAYVFISFFVIELLSAYVITIAHNIQINCYTYNGFEKYEDTFKLLFYVIFFIGWAIDFWVIINLKQDSNDDQNKIIEI